MKRRIRIAAALIVAAGTLSCGGGGSGGGGKTTLVFWEFFPAEVIRPLVDKFEATHPGIKVDLQQLTWQGGLEKISASVAAGTAPDLCEIGSTWEAKFASSGALQDWTAEVQPMLPQYRLWDAVNFDGRYFGMPWVMGTRALFYNKALFARAGLDSSKAPATWAEVLDASKRIRALGAETYGFGLQSGDRYKLFKKFMSLAWSNGGDILSPDRKRVVFDSPQNLAALEFYLSLRPHALMDRQEILDQGFKEGRIGMQISGAWLFKTIPHDAPSLRYGVGLVPAPAGGRHASFAGAEILASFKGSRHPREAFELARFLVAPENAAALCQAAKDVQPSSIGSENSDYYRERPMEQLFVRQLETAVAPPNISQWVEMEGAIEESLEEALHDKVTPREALKNAQRKLEALLAAKGS